MNLLKIIIFNYSKSSFNVEIRFMENTTLTEKVLNETHFTYHNVFLPSANKYVTQCILYYIKNYRKLMIRLRQILF